MELKEIRELIELISQKGLAEFELEREGFRLRITRFREEPNSQPPQLPIWQHHNAPPKQEAGPAAASAQPELHIIKSPIVGTFYRAPSPTSEPFVNIGDHVEPDTVVCIIEAMKLMNEIQAEVSGQVAEIYVENGQPVEYGQPLFGIRIK
jgi:acetyl-CoA carboxylase biotin carboxyl carrier protein